MMKQPKIRLRVQFPGIEPYWVEARPSEGGRKWVMSLPDYDGLKISFKGEPWGDAIRFTSTKPDRLDHFFVRDDWNEIEYHDAKLGESYAVAVLEVDDGE